MKTISQFETIETWIFDLDNTLYPPSADLFKQIEVKMTAYIAKHMGVTQTQANQMRDTYWRDHGLTLTGLMQEHDVDPLHFLNDVHDISFESLSKDAALAHTISSLSGRKIIFTNSDKAYAQKVVAARGLMDVFDAVYTIEDTGFTPKPQQKAFDLVVSADGFAPTRAAMFEDDPRNLKVPHDLGMATVLVHSTSADPHIHHTTDNLTQFLRQFV